MAIDHLRCDDKTRILKGLVHVQKDLLNGFNTLNLVEGVFELRPWTVKVFQLRQTLRMELLKEPGYLCKCFALVHD
jgi:hypothetical protein